MPIEFSTRLYKNIFDPLFLKEKAESLKYIEDKQTTIFEDDGVTVRSFFAPHWYDQEIKSFVYDNPMIPFIKEILGNDIYLHQAHFNYKSSKTGGEYAWHSDYTFWKAHDGMPKPEAVSVLFMLDDMTEENGPLVVLPGSEHLLVEKKSRVWTIKHDANERDGMITEHMVSVTGLQRHTVLGKAGDVFVMHANMWHTSPPNLSDTDRNILFLCYNKLDNKTTLDTRPEHITLRDFTLV